MKVYAAYNKDENIRKNSSSGGVFYEIARAVINRKGIVFGAKYDENWNVIHGHAENLEEIKEFLGSKYTQSAVRNECIEVKRELDKGRWCLFSGTPCQIAGLKAYLGKPYTQLLTIDFICHGVPSRSVWREYVQQHNKEKIRAISFRDKTEGWLKFSLKIEYTDGEVYRKSLSEDLYMKGFLQDIYLRPSCYECVFRGMERFSDITLADYWGVQKDLPEMFDDKGTSVVFIHSEFGAEICQQISGKFKYLEVDAERSIIYNGAMIKSSACPAKRDVFYENGGDFVVLEKITKEPRTRKIKQDVKRCIKKLIGKE